MMKSSLSFWIILSPINVSGTNVTYEVNIGDDIVPTFYMPWYDDINVTELIPDRPTPLSDRLQLYHDGKYAMLITMVIYREINVFGPLLTQLQFE